MSSSNEQDSFLYVKIAAVTLVFIGLIICIIYLVSLKDKCASSSDCLSLHSPYCDQTSGKCQVYPSNIASSCKIPCISPQICKGSICVTLPKQCKDCTADQSCNTDTGLCVTNPSSCASTCKHPSTCANGVCTPGACTPACTSEGQFCNSSTNPLMCTDNCYPEICGGTTKCKFEAGSWGCA